MHELRVDPEFRDKIPPLTDAEFEQLRENILSDGEVYEPIVVWNGTIVDGHNRWRIIQEHPEIPYKVREMDFTNKWAAFEWMYSKQLGRRNLTDEQRKYMIGKMYEARKNTSSFRGNQYTSGCSQNGNDQNKPNGRIGEIIAKELGVGHGTVTRAADFAKGIDILSGVSQEAADKVLSGKSVATQGAVAELKNATQEEVKEFSECVIADKKPPKSPRPQSKEMKEFNDKLNDVVEVMESDGKEYSLEDAVNDLNSAEDMFLMQIRFVLTEKTDVISTADGRTEFEHFIKSVIDDLNELKGELK